MKKLLVLASLLAASPSFADPVLVQIDPPPAWPVLERLYRPHSDEQIKARAADDPAPHDKPKRHRYWRHRRHK